MVYRDKVHIISGPMENNFGMGYPPISHLLTISHGPTVNAIIVDVVAIHYQGYQFVFILIYNCLIVIYCVHVIYSGNIVMVGFRFFF